MSLIDKEEWKDIFDYENFYMVSNMGRIFSKYSNKVLKSVKDAHGYYQISLYKEDKPKVFKIHQLVAFAFIPNKENKCTVNHINGDKLNNCVSNLEWCTITENIKHAFLTGLSNATGEHNNSAKLTDLKVFMIKGWLSLKYTNRQIAHAFNISQGTISDIKMNRTWKHIKFEY